MKILLRTTFSQWSGYGRDGIGLVLALLDRGHDVRLSPAHLDPPVPREIAGLLTLPINGPFDLALHHMEPEKANLGIEDAAAARLNVLWTMWGWPNLPEEPWVPEFALATQHFDHLVAYDPQSAGAFAAIVGDARVKTVLGGYSAEDWGQDGDRPARPYQFGMNGRLTMRKGVFTAYRAFCLLREQHGEDFDADLTLRSTAPVFPPGFPLPERVHEICARALPPELRRYYQSLDTLVCPSWAESKDLPPIEALTCGTPVILSDIPGHRIWATSDMVSWAPTEIQTIQPGYTGGYVAPEDLAAVMWEHYTNRLAQRIKAQQAARTLPAMLDWTRAVERLGLSIGLPL